MMVQRTPSAKVLHLVLTGYWFDEIDSGRKNVEYREFTPYWRKRISKPKIVVFHRGYTRNTIAFIIKDIQITDRFEIHLGERLARASLEDAKHGV